MKAAFNSVQVEGARSAIGDRLSVNAMRPYIAKDGSVKIAVNGHGIVVNTTALLQYDEWKDIDRAVIKETSQRLGGIRDLINGGLVHPLGTIGNTISLYERESDITGADVDMSGVTEGEEDTVVYDNVSVPVPVVHKDFRVNIRRLEASRRFGEPIDTTMGRLAAKAVAEKSEDMLFLGNSTIQVDGGVIKGYTTHADRNTASFSGAYWDVSGTTGAQVLTAVAAAIATLRADGFYGPYVLYIPGDAQGKMDEDYRSNDSRTIAQRVLALEGMSRIEVVDRLTTRNAVLVQLSTDVVDLAMAQDVTTVQWSSKGGMQEHFKVMAVWVPRVKSTFDGHSGICHLT